MNSDKVIIRADGSKDIGMGHLKRSCILRDFFRDKFGFETLLVTTKNEEASYFLSNYSINTCWIAADSIESELEELAALSKEINAGCRLFVLDVLENDINTEYINILKLFGAPVLSITDDSSKRTSNADLVLNGNPNQLKIDYTEESAHYLVGPEYFIMDPSYGESTCEFSNASPHQILLTLGGSDHNNLIFKVLESLKNIPNISLHVISSKGTGYLDRLSDYLLAYPVKNKLSYDVPSLKPFWCEVDFSITAGGNTLFERIAMGVPGITICQLERQNEIADRFESLGVNLNLGMGNSLSINEIRSEILFFIDSVDIRKEQYLNSPSILDGNGLNRLGNVLNKNFNL